MPVHLNLEDFDRRIRDLDVQIHFEIETGFPYLAEKLAEVMEKNQQATKVLCDLVMKMDLVRREITAQTLLVQTTGMQAHKDAKVEALGQMEILKTVQLVVRLHLGRLRKLPHDIKLYAHILQGALATEGVFTGHIPAKPTERPKSALTGVSSRGEERVISERVDFDIEGLFTN